MKNEIGNAIKKARMKVGLTRKQTAHLSGISESSLYKLEQCYTSDPKDETLRRLCNVLGLCYPIYCRDGEPDYEPVSCPHLYRRTPHATSAMYRRP